jgi:hypothetical protein
VVFTVLTFDGTETIHPHVPKVDSDAQLAFRFLLLWLFVWLQRRVSGRSRGGRTKRGDKLSLGDAEGRRGIRR